MSKPNNKEYGNRAVAFIDILGFASMVQRMDKSGDDYNTLMYALKKIKKYQEFAGSEITVQSKLEISVFSDCITISCKPKHIFSILWSCGYLFGDLLFSGIALRGGIATGKLHHTNGIIFGEGLIEAYNIETKVAIYPRIVISSEAKELLPVGANKFIKQDSDGLFYLNSFAFHPVPPGADMLLSDGYNPRVEYLRQVQKHIETNIASAVKLDHKAKWNWLATQYNNALDVERSDLGGELEKINA